MSAQTALAFVTHAYDWAKQVEKTFGIPARYALAQSALESGYGLHASGNRYFGIKATGSPNAYWNGSSTTLSTREGASQDTLKTMSQGFRTYTSGLNSFMDWGRLISTNKMYANVIANVGNDAAFIAALDASPYSTLKDGSYGSSFRKYLASIDRAIAVGKFATSGPGKVVAGILFFGVIVWATAKYI